MIVARSRCSFYHIFDAERDEEEGRCPITNDDDFHTLPGWDVSLASTQLNLSLTL